MALIRLAVPTNGPDWLLPLVRSIEALFRRPIQGASYNVADVPDATLNTAVVIFVPDEAGGPTLAFSDGTNWLRTTDNAPIT